MKRKLAYILVALAMCCKIGHALAQNTDSIFTLWSPGYLDIHHINTGRGNAAFFIFPDGTTMLVDAGELSPLDARTNSPRNAAIKPDSSRKPFEWLEHYIRQVGGAGRRSIDYALITHFHDDHFGAWYPDAPLSNSGKFRLTGITGVGDKFHFGTLIDRAAPLFNYPFDLTTATAANGGGEIRFEKTMENYFGFLGEKQSQGMKVEGLKVGVTGQIALLKAPSAYPNFFVRGIKSAQWIWNGRNAIPQNHFPEYNAAQADTWPDENSLSLAISVHYGPFTYYTGGDNPGVIFHGDNPKRNTETEIAGIVGAVDVAVMDHHGNRDAINEDMIRLMHPTVWIGQTWSADHPGHEVLLRMVNRHVSDKPSDLFATNMLEANKIVIGPLIDKSYKSQQGHIVVRVLPGGKQYYIIVLDDSTIEMAVKAVFGPYSSTEKQ